MIYNQSVDGKKVSVKIKWSQYGLYQRGKRMREKFFERKKFAGSNFELNNVQTYPE